ncbi:hypothetical protein V7S43_003658 [Phytophthora oleae]|uniref:EF-hand domain-containing protein n=1 Tax=Phytophthora oleae TaxID=2107226 RepID=A0ABD3FXU7_9STRA
MENLDASYTLLSDVNARNRALRARLNSSLPLLWKNNALVMTSAVGPRRRCAGFSESEQSEADQMLLALEDQSSLQVSQRYKRRVEWEVARRIARVDRELQQYPPAQRFWNQRRKQSPSSNKQRVDGVRRVGAPGTVGGVMTGKKVVERMQKEVNGDIQLRKKAWTKPKIVMESGEDERKVVKHAATSSFRVDIEVAEDKENATPNTATTGKEGFEKKLGVSGAKESPLFKDDPQDDRSVLKNVIKDDKLEDPVATFGTNSNSSSQPADAKPDSPNQATKAPADDIFSKERGSIPDLLQESDDDDMFTIEGGSPRRTKTPAEERPSSSIGRQVLSDFRTMPSVASFGAQPILSGAMGNPGGVRLNVDALRRLFSDLDTDKDGHVNRIETCMALHRLQIPVPTTRIISFFRQIHSSNDGKPVRGRHTQHLPMNEVVNYKEFVAFVTTAYDQQQQRKAQRKRVPMRRNESHNLTPKLSVPSTYLPIYSHPTNSSGVKRSVDPPLSREQDVRVYEINEPEVEQGEATVEERVLKEIPEFLISRIIAESSSTEVKENAVSAVRKSVELLLGEAVDDKIVNEITQELIRRQLRSIEALDDQDDVTGLKRAEAYYNEQTMKGDADSVVEDLESEGFVNWVDVLTEEQVSGLVQQIWKLKQTSVHQSSLVSVEDVRIEDFADVLEDPPVKSIDEATDTSELVASATLSSKAVQAFDEENQEEPPSTFEDIDVTIPEPEQVVSPPVIAAMPDPEDTTQTHFGKELSTVLGGFGTQEFFEPATSLNILQRLRQQRRAHQNVFNEQQMLSHSDEAVRWSLGSSASTRDRLERESLFSSEENSESVSSRSVKQDHRQLKAEMRDPETLPRPEPSSLAQKILDFSDSASSLELAGNISVSSSSFSSISAYHHMYSIHREIDHHQLRASSRRRRPYRRTIHLSVSGSSVPDSICSAELSEGELSGEELSDGEIFGETKRNFARHKNEALDNKDDDENLQNSIESGEIPALMKAHANFRRQLVQSSSSSVESGELEDGAVPN